MFDLKIAAAVLALTTSVAVASPQAETGAPAELDALSLLPGDWKIVDPRTGEEKQGCDRPQRFAVSDDGKTVVLTEPWANFTARYSVIVREGRRVLTVIEGEKRRTDQGDPVLWWISLEDADHFRFRRYDWAQNDATIDQWQRCPATPISKGG